MARSISLLRQSVGPATGTAAAARPFTILSKQSGEEYKKMVRFLCDFYIVCFFYLLPVERVKNIYSVFSFQFYFLLHPFHFYFVINQSMFLPQELFATHERNGPSRESTRDHLRLSHGRLE